MDQDTLSVLQYFSSSWLQCFKIFQRFVSVELNLICLSYCNIILTLVTIVLNKVFLVFFLMYFRFWGTCADHAGLLHRYIHGKVFCCLRSPHHLYLTFLPMLSLPNLPTHCCPSPFPSQQTPVCDALLPVSMCFRCSTPAYEWEHVAFDFLFLCQFAENDGFQIHPCPYKGHELIVFYGCIVFRGIYVHFCFWDGISLGRPGWSAIAQSWLTATFATQVQVILLCQPPE